MSPVLTVWVDFSLANNVAPRVLDFAFAEAKRAAGPVNVELVRDLPADQLPGAYLTVRVLPTSPVPWRPGVPGWSNHLVSHTDLYKHCDCWACWQGDPVLLGSVIAHEGVGHGLAPLGTPHTTGLFAAQGDIRGLDFAPADIALRNKFLPDLARGFRWGDFDSPAGRQRDSHWLSKVDPNWQLPVITPGYLIFAAGACPPLELIPGGWRVEPAGAATGGKAVADFARGVLYHPGPVAGSPKAAGSAIVFAPGDTPEAEWAPARGWRTYRGQSTGGKVTVEAGRVNRP